MWYLIEDFFEQSWIMKLFIAWGWASVLIMGLSLVTTVWPMLTAAVVSFVEVMNAKMKDFTASDTNGDGRVSFQEVTAIESKQ